MAPWETHFQQGSIAFSHAEYTIALQEFNKAIAAGGKRHDVYDSRADTFEKLGRFSRALKDSRKVIELAPEMCHGYVRSARLFLKLEMHTAALDIISLSQERVSTQYPAGRMELERLQREISQRRDKILKKPPEIPYFSKLPVELISEVFLLGTEEDSAFPALVCLVCSYWRTLALSMPLLWHCVTLSDKSPVYKMTLWLERSQNRITSLQIRRTISRLQLHDALEFCIPNFFTSLKSVHCEVDVAHLTSLLMNIPDVHKLNLETLNVSLSVNTISPLGPLVPLDRTSTVHTLILEHVAVDWLTVAPRLSHLRILVIRTIGRGAPMAEQLYQLLSENPHLEKFIWQTGEPRGLVSLRGRKRIVLSHLSHLELLGPIDAGIVVSHLSLPLLACFAISRCLCSANHVMDALYPPSMPLTELNISRCYFSADPLASFMRTMSGLTKLAITYSASMMDPVVEAIAGSQTVDGETQLVCPFLEHVDFSYCTKLNGGPIMQLVLPRLLVLSSDTFKPARIESIRIDGCPRIDSSALEWLRSRVKKLSSRYMSREEARRLQL